MDWIVVKVERRRSQTRITIPKRIAEGSGLVDSELAAVGLNLDGVVEVMQVDVRQGKESGVSERKNGVD